MGVLVSLALSVGTGLSARATGGAADFLGIAAGGGIDTHVVTGAALVATGFLCGTTGAANTGCLTTCVAIATLAALVTTGNQSTGTFALTAGTDLATGAGIVT